MTDDLPEPNDTRIDGESGDAAVGTDGRGSVSRRRFLAGTGAVGGALALSTLPSLAAANDQSATFTVRVENVSDRTGATLDPSTDASDVPNVLSPGAYAVHARGEPMFSHGDPERMNGLEEIAEDGDPSRMVATLEANRNVARAGAFTTPVGATMAGPLTPGDAYEFEVEADRRAGYLSLVTMFVQSNDLFYSLGGPGGIRLFDGRDPVRGDVTDRVGLWDAGTEINEEPGAGENQAPRQRAPGVGLVERGTVAPIEEVNGYDYPATADVVRVALSLPT